MKKVVTIVYSHLMKKEQVIYDPLNTLREEKDNYLCYQNAVNLYPQNINLNKVFAHSYGDDKSIWLFYIHFCYF